jgi:uncharacterized protein (TIGR03083 family)
MALATAEREDLASFLEALAPDQWDAPTLCSQWTVRDVAAHVVSYDELDRAGLVRRYVRGRLHPNRVNAVGVADYAARSPEQLVALLRQHAVPTGLTAGFGGRIALVDALIHHQDVRRPLGLSREVPPERLRAALPFARVAPPIRGPWHTRGLRLVATDLDWSSGRGKEVRGAGEALLLAIAGRRGVAHELSGPGRETLARRLG